MYDFTLDVTARTAFAAVSSPAHIPSLADIPWIGHVVLAVDLATVALALAAVAAVMVITAVVSTFTEAYVRRLSNRSYHVGPPTGSGDDATGAVTALILVVVVVVAAMLIGVPL